MSVVLTPPLNAPANPAANAVAGGNLVVGRTYYFKICARTHNTYLMNSADKRCSPPSVEVSATPDIANRTITISWDAVPDANAYCIYVRWDAVAWKMIGTTNVPTTTNTTYDFTTESNSISNTLDLFTSTVDTPLDISKDTGVGLAVISGAETLDNIYDTIVASYPEYAKKTKGYYVFRFHIQSSGTGSLTIPYGTIICPLQCVIDNPSAAFTWTWQGGSKLYINAWSWRALMYSYNHVFQSKVYLIGGGYMGLGAKAWLFGGDNYVCFNLDRTDPSNSIVDHLTTGISGTGKVENVEVIDNYFRLDSNNAYAENCKAKRIGIWHNSALGDGYFRDCEATEINFNIYSYYGSNLGDDFPFYDCTFNGYDDSDPNKPRIYYYNNDMARGFHAGIFRSLKLKVIKANGDAIPEATVKMWDKNDNLVLDTTTDQNGEITKTDIKVVRTSWQSGSANSSVSSYEEYGPFTLEIFKSGHYRYISKFDLTKKIDCPISLPPAETEAPAQPTGLFVDTPPGRPSGLSIENPDPTPARPSGLTIEEV